MQGPRKPERVSPFKKAKTAMEQRAEIAKRKRRDEESLKETWRTLLRNNVSDMTPLPRGPEIETHSSHTLIACGGWGGCVACGGMSSGGPSNLLKRECRKWMPPSTKRDIAKLADGTMPHFLVHGKWPDGSVAPRARQWIPECFNDTAVDDETRAAAVERYSAYMFAQAETSSEESWSDKGDEEEGRRIAAMDDHPPKPDAKKNDEAEQDGGQAGARDDDNQLCRRQ